MRYVGELELCWIGEGMEGGVMAAYLGGVYTMSIMSDGMGLVRD